jgi:hypothetical protein
MKRGQLCVEAVLAVSLVIVYLSLIYAMSAAMQEEAADRSLQLSREMSCIELSSIIGAVYSGGDGAEAEYEVRQNYTLNPGIIESDDGFFCEMPASAVSEQVSLPEGAYTLRNGGDRVEFT